MKKHLLLTNDDGIEAVGLQLLLSALKDHYKITVVAPTTEKSGSGLSISTKDAIHVKRVFLGENIVAYSVDGTPADCVKLAIGGGLSERPDLIVSGINPGSNAGRNLFYSGTVGAVIEASFKGIPGIALSMQWKHPVFPELSSAIPLSLELIAELLESPLSEGSFLNVNFPSLGPYQGAKWTKQGIGVWKEEPHTTSDFSGESISYHLGMRHHLPEEEDSDTYWLERGFVTIVPLKTELTDHKFLEKKIK